MRLTELSSNTEKEQGLKYSGHSKIKRWVDKFKIHMEMQIKPRLTIRLQ